MRKSILITLIVGVVWSPAAVLSELTLAGVSIQPSSQGAKNPLSLEQKAEEIALLLPEGAKVAWFDPQGHGNLEKAILMVHAKESGSQPQVAVIYEKSSGKADISSQPLSLAIFSHRDGQLYKEWETELAGPQLWMQDGKSIGFQVVDVDADGKDEILTITGMGASLGARLQIIAWDGKSYRQITPQIEGHQFELSRDERGFLRIRARSRYEELFHIYEWEGKQYLEVEAGNYFRREAEFYENVLLGPEAITPYLFGDYLQRAVWNYRKAGDINKALELCEQALHVLDQPGKLAPVLPSEEANLTSQQREAIRENFERSRSSLHALLHSLLGELNEQRGDFEAALKHFREALQFDPSDQGLRNRIKAIEHRLQRSP